MKITEIILDEIKMSGIANIKEGIDKKRKEEFLKKLLEEVQQKYIFEYGNEKYFNELDGFLETNKFINNIVNVVFSKTGDKSLNKFSAEYTQKFLVENSKYSVCQNSISEILNFLSDTIRDAILSSDMFELEERMYSRIQNQNNIVIENQDEMKIQQNKLMDMISQMHTYILGKTEENRKETENDYKLLLEIHDDDSLSFYQKEIAYIGWICTNSDLKEGLVFLANNCVSANDKERAIVYYNEIISRYVSQEYELCNNLGLLYLEKGLYDEAKKQFQIALEYCNNNLNAMYNLAVMYRKNAMYDESMDWIKKVLRLWPNDVDSICFYASLLMEDPECDLEEVIEVLENGIRMFPDNFNLKINLGYAYLFKKDFDVGIELLEKLYSENSNKLLCVALLATMYSIKNVEKPEKAIPLFEKAYEMTKEEGYRRNIRFLTQGDFFDSVLYNGRVRYIYTDEELEEYYKLNNK